MCRYLFDIFYSHRHFLFYATRRNSNDFVCISKFFYSKFQYYRYPKVATHFRQAPYRHWLSLPHHPVTTIHYIITSVDPENCQRCILTTQLTQREYETSVRSNLWFALVVFTWHLTDLSNCVGRNKRRTLFRLFKSRLGEPGNLQGCEYCYIIEEIFPFILCKYQFNPYVLNKFNPAMQHKFTSKNKSIIF